LQREERVEYRDHQGNLLDPERVKELEGKVEFKTRYETRTRVVDANGNEVHIPADAEDAAQKPVAPPHPDVEGADSSTHDRADKGAGSAAQAAVKSRDGEKEAEQEKPKPASEGSEATARAA
jgi:dolichyl-phosphate-mannose-protein mannosyltransferase